MSAGRVWKFGDDVNTDLLAPGVYMKGPLEELAAHCLEELEPAFAREVRAGDIVVAGKNFGTGSSREQAAQVLRMLGVTAVLAPSFGGIFYRNAFNLGLLALVCPDTAKMEKGQQLEIDPLQGIVRNLTTGQALACDAIPEHLAAIAAAGGLIPFLEATLPREP